MCNNVLINYEYNELWIMNNELIIKKYNLVIFNSHDGLLPKLDASDSNRRN